MDKYFFTPAACYGHAEMLREMEELSRSPVAQLEILGISPEGREIPVLRVGKPDAKYHVLLQGAIHGREHMTSWLLMGLAKQEAARGPSPEFCWHFLPMANPDGVSVSQRCLLTQQQWKIYQADLAADRTEENPHHYAQRWKANGSGVDLNRNFPAGWELVNGPEGPSTQNYRGTFPFSEVETRILRDYTLRYPFAVTLSYHATGSVIYYEYGHREPVSGLSKSLGQAVAAVTGYEMEGCAGLDGAGYKDWVMASLGIPSLTIEIGKEEAPLAAWEAPDVWCRNKEVLTAVEWWLEKTQQT